MITKIFRIIDISKVTGALGMTFVPITTDFDWVVRYIAESHDSSLTPSRISEISCGLSYIRIIWCETTLKIGFKIF